MECLNIFEKDNSHDFNKQNFFKSVYFLNSKDKFDNITGNIRGEI
jgi:hypothetical protein